MIECYLVILCNWDIVVYSLDIYLSIGCWEQGLVKPELYPFILKLASLFIK